MDKKGYLMGAFEREMIEKIQQLKPAARQRVWALIEQESADSAVTFDYDRWFHQVETLRQEIFTGQKNNTSSVDVIGILRDIRDGEDE